MTTALLHTHTPNIGVGRGQVFLATLDANDLEGPLEYMGTSQSLTISVESPILEHQNFEGGIGNVDKTENLSNNRSGQLVSDDITAKNIARFLAGTASTFTQSSTPITDEQIFAAGFAAEKYAQLGATAANPSGVRNVSAVALTCKTADDAATRVDSTAYVVGDFYLSIAGDLYVVTVAGTSNGTPPTFNTTAIGDTTVDGTATVKFLGDETYAVTTDYLVNSALGLLMPVSGGKIALQVAALPVGAKLTGNADYTPAAETRNRVTSTSSGSSNVALKYIADNPSALNYDTYLPKVLMIGSGDAAFKGEEFLGLTFDLNIQEKNTSTAAVYVDGRAS